MGTWCGTGSGCDSLHSEPLLLDASRLVPNRRFEAVFDTGYDREDNHRMARQDMHCKASCRR